MELEPNFVLAEHQTLAKNNAFARFQKALEQAIEVSIQEVSDKTDTNLVFRSSGALFALRWAKLWFEQDQAQAKEAAETGAKFFSE